MTPNPRWYSRFWLLMIAILICTQTGCGSDECKGAPDYSKPNFSIEAIHVQGSSTAYHNGDTISLSTAGPNPHLIIDVTTAGNYMEKDCQRAEPYASGSPVALYSGRSQNGVKLHLVKPSFPYDPSKLVYSEGMYWLCQNSFSVEWPIPDDYMPYDDVPIKMALTVGLESPENANPFPRCFQTYDTAEIILVLEEISEGPSAEVDLDVRVTPPRGEQGELFQVLVSGLGPDNAATVGLTAPGGTAEKPLYDDLTSDNTGQARFSIGSDSSMEPGIYTVSVEVNDASARGEATFELMAKETMPSATVSVEGTTVTRSEIENDPGDVPLGWSIYKEGELYKAIGARDMESLDMSAYPPGEYIVVLEIDTSQPTDEEYQLVPISNSVTVTVPVTEPSYVLPHAWTTIMRETYRWGQNETVHLRCACDETRVADGEPSDRFVDVQVNRVCPDQAGCEFLEGSYVHKIDRLSGLMVDTTCTDCFEAYIGPQPDAENVERISVAGREVEVVSREWQESEVQPESSGDGFWEWEGTHTARYDMATGVCVSDRYDGKSFYTGGGETHRHYGHWATSEVELVETTFPYGGIPSVDEEKPPSE